MFYDFNIEIYELIPSKSNTGKITNTINLLSSAICDIQPYSRELALKDYGIDENVTNRLFMDLNQDIKIGNIIKNEDKYYIIKAFLKWEHMEVIVDEYKL